MKGKSASTQSHTSDFEAGIAIGLQWLVQVSRKEMCNGSQRHICNIMYLMTGTSEVQHSQYAVPET